MRKLLPNSCQQLLATIRGYEYTEHYYTWTAWGIGALRFGNRSWQKNEVVIYLGPLRLVFENKSLRD